MMAVGLDTAMRLAQAPIGGEGHTSLLVNAQCPCGHQYRWTRGNLLQVLADIFDHERDAHGAK